MAESQTALPELIRRLLQSEAWPHDADYPELIETHISWVILTGPYAYKIKKPVELNFVDFRTLARRRAACIDELRLNRRLAPEIYCRVVPIGGNPSMPVVNGEPAIEYAVQMRQFPQAALLEYQLEHGLLSVLDMRRAARMVANFHSSLEGAPSSTPFGTPRSILDPFADTLHDLEDEMHRLCAGLTGEIRRLHSSLESLMEMRKSSGFVRECHGDLHLRNLIRLNERIVAFDCLEFSSELRWIDVINEVAFLFMDLQAHEASALGYRFVNDYLQQTGDYEGLALLYYYSAYHALVRAKVAKLASDDGALGRYLQLADGTLRRTEGLLVLTHGLSGSGKTTVTESLIDALPAIRIRSDIERKRLAGLAPRARTHAQYGQGIYDEAGTRSTYERLLELAFPGLRAGCNVIVDAAFLKAWQRRLFLDATLESGLEVVVLDVTAPVPLLRERVRQRDAAGSVSEASTDILDRQLQEVEALGPAELRQRVEVDTRTGVDAAGLVRRIAARRTRR